MRRQSGFTLIELLVTVAIIGVLIALLLPAIQAARQAARTTECRSRLRQIGVALHAHHQAVRSLPPGNETKSEGICYGSPNPNKSGGYPTDDGANWLVHLLPYLEQNSLSKEYDFAAFNEAPANREVRETFIAVYACPADQGVQQLTVPGIGPASPLALELPYMPGSYRAVSGKSDGLRFLDSSEAGDYDPAYRGAIHTVGIQNYHTERFEDIQDGLSNTLMVGESTTSTSLTMRTLWAYSHSFYTLSAITPQPRILLGDYDECKATDGAGGSLPCRRGWGSFHPGISNFLWCDGSARSVSTEIDMDALAAMATIEGHEVQINTGY